MDDMNNFNNSNIRRPQNKDDLNIKINDNVRIEQLLNENANYSFLLKINNLILKEYQEKYNNEIFSKIMKDCEENEELKEKLNERDLSNCKRMFIEYEKKIKEKDDLIRNLREEKERIVLNNQKILEENNQLQNELEQIKKDNDDIYKALEERTKKTQNKIKDKSKTFSNMNFKGKIEIENNQINNTNNNINMDNINFNTNTNFNKNINNIINKENINFKEKVDYEEMISKLKKEIDSLKNQLYNLQNRLKKEMEENNKIESDYNLKQIEIDKLLIDNKAFKGQLNEYKEAYDNLEKRKENEVQNLIEEIKEIRLSNETYKKNNKSLEEENSMFKFTNSKLKQENEGLKFDRDHLTKIIEDSNITVQNATEKEKYFDSIIKDYKKKNDDINLEKEILNKKLQMKDNQINKINLDFNNILKEKTNNYENLNNITKNKYEDIINNKESEIKELKATILS